MSKGIVTDYENFVIRKEPPLGFLGINRLHVRNALTIEMWRTIPVALADLYGDSEIKAIILYGCGEIFSAGQDLRELLQLANRDGAEVFLNSIEGAIRSIERAPIPVVAMIDGYALGSALLLALGCDLRTASSRALVGVPIGRLGLMFSTALIMRLVRFAGLAKATELLMTGKKMDAQEARESGLITQVYPQGELLDKTVELANQIVKNAPLTVWSAKDTLRCCRPGWTLPWELDQDPFVKCFESNDFKEGLNAFLEKRVPHFGGNYP